MGKQLGGGWNGGAGGRPSDYKPDIVERICHLVATEPHGIPALCAKYSDLPNPDTIYSWVSRFPEFSDKFYSAKRLQATVLVEHTANLINTIERGHDKDGNAKIDAGILGQAKLQADYNKWQAARLAPKVWGENKQIEDLQQANSQVQTELAALRAELAEKNKREY